MNVRQLWITGLVASAALAGPAGVADAGLLSAKGPVIAILAGELYVGEAEGHWNGAGTLAIHSQKDPGLTCAGEFTSSASSVARGSCAAAIDAPRYSAFNDWTCTAAMAPDRSAVAR